MASPSESAENFALFRDCLSATLLRPASSSPVKESKSRRRRRQHHRQEEDKPDAHRHGDPDPPLPGATDPERDAEDLSDFIDYLAAEMFDCLPEEVQQLDYRSWRDSPAVQSDFSLPLTSTSPGLVSLAAALPPSVLDTLTTYGLFVSDGPEPFLAPILTAYLTPLAAAPPASAATRTDACELCARGWVPLSYHHLIPRFVHDKAVKRGWHRPEDLQNVAWLCGACHRFVHQFKGHEELAREYYTVERLLGEEEVQRWVAWVGRLRWKGGRARKRA